MTPIISPTGNWIGVVLFLLLFYLKGFVFADLMRKLHHFQRLGNGLEEKLEGCEESWCL